MNEQKPKSGLAIASMVLGIFSVFCFGILTGLPAIIMGHISHNRARKSPDVYGGTGFAIAGFVMGYVSIITTLILAGMWLSARANDKEKKQSIYCVSNLKQIVVCGQIYAHNHEEVFPIDFMTMKKELGTPKILICPSDKGKTATENWLNFNPQTISYEMVSPSVQMEDSSTNVFVRCPFHGHAGHVNGFVEMEMGRKK